MLLLELPFPFALMIALIYLLFNKYMPILVLEEQRNVSYGTVFELVQMCSISKTGNLPCCLKY